MSKKIPIHFGLSITWSIGDATASCTDLPFFKPNWFGTRMLYLLRKLIRRELSRFSRIFERAGNSDIGRSYCQSL